jgi:CheY-like chemotaxis protein
MKRKSPRRQAPKRRVLIAEDNEDAGLSLEMLIESLGFEVHLVMDGESAVRKSLAWQPHLIVMDIGMPLLSGYDATQIIRAHKQTTRPVIVMLSGWGRLKDIDLSKAAGADFHLTKPLDFSALRKILDSVALSPIS